MAIPDFQSVMLPLIETLADGQERTMRALTDLLAGRFGLTEAGASGTPAQRAAEHLQQPGRLVQVAPEVCRPAGEPGEGAGPHLRTGRKVLAEKPQAINVKFLKRFPSYCEFIGKSESKAEGEGTGRRRSSRRIGPPSN